MLRAMLKAYEALPEPADAYDSVADRYDSFYAGELERAQDRAVLNFLITRGLIKGDVLDVGCGTGALLDIAARDFSFSTTGLEYVGVDPSASMLRVARRKRPSADWRQGSFELLSQIFGSPGRKFDSVVSLYGSFCYAEPLAAADEVLARVAPGGMFAVMVYGPASHGSRVLQEAGAETEFRRYAAKGLRDLFFPCEVSGFGSCPQLMADLPEHRKVELVNLELVAPGAGHLATSEFLIVTGRR